MKKIKFNKRCGIIDNGPIGDKGLLESLDRGVRRLPEGESFGFEVFRLVVEGELRTGGSGVSNARFMTLTFKTSFRSFFMATIMKTRV